MKKILSAIGGFFKRIWRWIAETAWIQPLLIVGLIFAVIFSIPSITRWINEKAESSGQYAFYNSNRVKASQVLANLEDDGLLLEYADQSEEERFLLVIIEEDCENCKTDEAAFKYFNKNYNYDGKQEKPVMKFIYQWKDEEDDADAPSYIELMDKYGYTDLVDAAYQETADANGLDYTDYFEDFENRVIPTPCMILYEHGEIVDAFFGAQGETTIQRAEFISDFYFHKGTFEGLTNK